MKKLAIITSHPIQYNAPLFKILAERGNIDIKVFYTWSQTKNGFFDVEFNKTIEWDIPLLDGYNYEFIKNVSKKPSSRHYLGIICPNLIVKIDEYNPTSILVYGWSFHAHLNVIKHFKGKIPVFFRGDSTLLDERLGIKKIFRKLLLKNIYRFVDYAFFVGTHNKEYFKNAGLNENQLIHLPYVIDKNRFDDNNKNQYEKKAFEIRSNLKIKEKETVVSFIGKFIKKKNPIFVLKSIKKFNLKNKNKIKLIFIGSGKLEHDLKRLAGDDENIIFLPFKNQKEMPIIYRISNIFILPSKGPNETWGVSVNEAFASNRFVLVSDKVGSAIDLVKNNVNGEIFKSNNTSDFIEKLSLLQMKSKFINRPNNWTLEKIAKKIESVVNNL